MLQDWFFKATPARLAHLDHSSIAFDDVFRIAGEVALLEPSPC